MDNLADEVDLKLYKTVGSFKIYLIDDFKFRSKSLEMNEFGGFASNVEQPVIPDNEIWVSKYYEGKEVELFIANCIEQHRQMDLGLDRWTAYDKSLNLEKDLRIKMYNAPEILITSTDNIPKDLSKELYLKYANEDLNVFIVDGFEIRNYFKTDFVCGGHGYVYSWIPKNEIWVEKQTNLDELPYTLIHEYIERTLMKVNSEMYRDCHPVASKADFSFRPDKLKKEDIENLTEAKAFEIISKLT